MCKETKLFTEKSFLLLGISLPVSLDDMSPIDWSLLFSDLFVLFLSVGIWNSDLRQEQLGWMGSLVQLRMPLCPPGSQQVVHQHQGGSATSQQAKLQQREGQQQSIFHSLSLFRR